MEQRSRDLSYRTRVRRELALTVYLRVQDADAPRVRYARSALTSTGEIAGTTVDISEGGIGIIVDTYLPRWTRIWIRIPSPVEGQPPLLALATTVHRSVMCDRRPAYLLGLGFHDLTSEETGAVLTLLDQADEDEGNPAPARPAKGAAC